MHPIKKAIDEQDLETLERYKPEILQRRDFRIYAFRKREEPMNLIFQWYLKNPVKTITCANAIPLLVVTASYANYPERIRLYEMMRASFNRFPGLEPTFLLAASGEIWRDSPYCTWYNERKTPQFLAIKEMIMKMGRDAYPEDMIMMLCDDDDTLLTIPYELCVMAENTGIDGIRSKQALPLDADGNFVGINAEAPLEQIDALSQMFSVDNDLSGYTCRWGMFYDFMSKAEIRGSVLLMNLFDTTFMSWVDSLRTLDARQPYIFRRPPTGVWSENQ